MLYGIDIASYQSNLDLYKVKADFVIVKVTEGTSYINPCCDNHVQQTIALGKKLGFYHYAQNAHNSAKSEADYFISNCKGYFGKGIPVLDWEETVHDVQWALEWLQTVERETGVKPLIYMSESVVNSYDWSSVANAGYGLWVAKYRDYDLDYNYDMTNAGAEPQAKYWDFYAMWQFTSSGRLDGYNGNLDCNVFYGDLAAWDKYAGTSNNVADQPVEPTQPVEQPKQTTYNIGDQVRFSTCYMSAYSSIDEHINASDMSRDYGTITAIYNGTNNPYLLDHGLCFVNDGDIREVLNAPVQTQGTVTFPQSGGTWNVYPLGAAPVYGNQIGQINPGYYGDLTYVIVDQPQTNVVTIDTETFGRVNVYASSDDGVRFN